MLAAYYSEPGPAKDVIQLGDVDVPGITAGEILVKLHSSGVNPSDIKSRTTMFDRVKDIVPVIPHYDGAGLVEAVGDAVTGLSVGDRVWVALGQWRGSNGTCAEYIAIDQNLVLPLPDNTTFAEGACLGVPVLTALHALSLGPSVDGKDVLITGGATSVGNYAIQLAKHAGARVLTTAGSETGAGLARAAGADDVIAYKSEDVVEKVRDLTDGQGVDYLVDMDMSYYARIYPQLVTRGGFIAAYGSNHGTADTVPTHQFCMQDLTLRGLLLLNLDNQFIGELGLLANQFLDDSKLRHNIGAVFPLKETAQAHETVELGNVTGNVVIEIN